jgi:hypothetical protein
LARKRTYLYVLEGFEAPEKERSTRMIYGRTRVPAERGSKRTTARAMVSKRSTPLLYGGVMDGLVISFSLSQRVYHHHQVHESCGLKLLPGSIPYYTAQYRPSH